jgi:hypothetical protein
MLEAPASSSIVFAGGAPGLMTRLPLVGRVGAPIFAADSDRFDPRDWLADEGHSSLVNALPLTDGRQLDVARNRVVWHGWARDLDANSPVIDHLTSLLDALPREPPVHRTITEVLPAGLAALLPLIDKWALSDDDARVHRIGRASSASLSALWSTISPHLGAIDRFIEAAGASRAEDAALLGDLAQAAHEARAELNTRGVVLAG